MTERWVLTADGLHKTCPKHPAVGEFLRLENCPLCANEPVGDPGEDLEIDDDPDDIVAEVEVREFSKYAKRLAQDLAEKESVAERNAGAKWADVYLKAVRAWREMRDPRLIRKHDRFLVAHDAAIKGLRGSH